MLHNAMPPARCQGTRATECGTCATATANKAGSTRINKQVADGISPPALCASKKNKATCRMQWQWHVNACAATTLCMLSLFLCIECRLSDAARAHSNSEYRLRIK